MKYEITKNYIGAEPDITWIHGAPTCVIGHATGNDGTATSPDTDEGERAFEARTWNSAYVHWFADWDSITEIADPKKPAYGSGHGGNVRGIQGELCQVSKNDPNGPAKFAASYDRWTWAHAFYLFTEIHAAPTPAIGPDQGTVFGHFDVTKFYGNTDHTDPKEYLASWGKDWYKDVIPDITRHYVELSRYFMQVADANEIIEEHLRDSFAIDNVQHYEFDCASDEDKVKRHELAQKLRRVSGQIDDDGELLTIADQKYITERWLSRKWAKLSKEAQERNHYLANELRAATGQARI